MEKQSDPKLDAKRQLVKILMNAGLLGVGAGATYSGLRHALAPLKKPLPAVDAGSQLYDPIETIRAEPEVPQIKAAAGGITDALAKSVPDWFTPMTGANAKNNWPVLGLGIPLIAAGAYAGSTGLDKLMKAFKDRQKSMELSEAERAYHQAVKQQFQTAMMDKSALDTVYEKYASTQQPAGAPMYEKSPFINKTLPNIASGVGEAIGNLGGALAEGFGRAGAEAYKNPLVNIGTGAYVGGLGLTGLLGMYLGHKYNRKRQQDKVMERAILERRRARGLLQPLYAVPGSSNADE